MPAAFPAEPARWAAATAVPTCYALVASGWVLERVTEGDGSGNSVTPPGAPRGTHSPAHYFIPITKQSSDSTLTEPLPPTADMLMKNQPENTYINFLKNMQIPP